MTEQELCRLAQEMCQRAYCPYSHFAVGAALECVDGSVYTGCNIENAAYSPSLCAERVAVAKAVSEGKRQFRRIAIASSGSEVCVPCGVCRQVLLEFAPDLEILCLGRAEQVERYVLADLLPHGFGPSQLG